VNCFCLEGYECEFRKEIAVKVAFGTSEEGLTQDIAEEIISILKNSTEFIENLRLNYALAKGIEVNQVIFKELYLL